VRREDDFIAGANARRTKAEDETVSRVADTKRVRHAEVSGESILELGQIALLNKGTATKNVADYLNEFFFPGRESAAVVEEGNVGLS
jgi:hypothetical protein